MLCPRKKASMTRDEAIARLKQSETILKKVGVRHLYLFGSTARDEARPESDVDLFFDHDYGALICFDIMHIKDMATDMLDTRTEMITRRGLNHVMKDKIEA